MEQVHNGREDWKIYLSYVDFTRIFNVIKKFPKSTHTFLREGITLPLSYSSIVIKRIFFYELKTYMDIIDTRSYHEFTIGKDISVETVFLQ